MTYVYMDNVTATEKFYSTSIVQEFQEVRFHLAPELLSSDISLEQAIEPLVPRIPDLAVQAELAKRSCAQPADGLSCDESASIYLLTMRSGPRDRCLYFLLNAAFRSQDYTELDVFKLYLRLLLTALNRLPSSRVTFHQEIEHDRNRQLRRNNFLLLHGLTLLSLSTPLSPAEHSATFYTKTRTAFAFDCQSAKFIEQHSSDRSTNEFLLLPSYFHYVRHLDRRNDLNIIHVREHIPSSPLICFGDVVSPENQTSTVTVKSFTEANASTVLYDNPALHRLIAAHLPRSQMNLTYQNLTVDDMPIITDKAIVGKQCTLLLLDNNYITFECMAILVTALPENTTMTELHLRRTGLYDSSVQMLAQVLARDNCAVRALMLEGNYINDQGAGYLAEMLKTNKTLKILRLRGNPIGRKGAKLLREVVGDQNKTVEELFINEDDLKKRSTARTFLRKFSCTDI